MNNAPLSQARRWVTFKCSGLSNEEQIVQMLWPRTLRLLEQYAGNRILARRYLFRAGFGVELCRTIVREAFQRRHARKAVRRNVENSL